MTSPLVLFALSTDLQLDDVLIESETLTLLLASLRSEQACPDCASISSRVHSCYSRRLADLPCQGRAVELRLKVRRFFCENPACSRQTFAEQFPDLASAHARRTLRQGKTLGEIAFALGGRAGARLARFLGLPVSFWTLLRLLRRTPIAPTSTPLTLGHHLVFCVMVQSRKTGSQFRPGLSTFPFLPLHKTRDGVNFSV